MKPTMKLRWIKTNSLYKGDPCITNSYDEHFVLQQWWEAEQIITIGNKTESKFVGEWRDVPTGNDL